MKRQFTFIYRLAILAVAGGLAVTVVNAQDTEQGGSGDVTGHPTTDSPYLRPKPKPSAAAQQATKLSQKDRTFVSKVAAGGVQEVADAEVAMKQGGEGVKKVASTIASERGSNNKELLALAKKKGLGLGTDKIKPRSMGTKAYDKQYLYTTSHDYQEDISLFQKEAQSGDDKDIKAWAAKTLPMLKAHLGMLKSAGK